MKQLLLSLLTILILDLLLSKCANPKAPTGGPQDTIPPTLITAFPLIESLNTNEQEITLTFDEPVDAQKIKQNLIITPNIDIKYKNITRKNDLVLKFEEPFPDSTTITFNFFDGIVDITEGNPAVNLVYVFSTGDFLDSMLISGEVHDLLTMSPREKIIIGLYPYTDSLDIFTSKPTYFTSSSKEGLFQISNIKTGTYKLLAFADNNRNLLFDANQEAYGFLADSLVLDSNVVDLSIPLITEDASELKLITSRSLGDYFDIQYSKGISSVELSREIYNNLSEDFKSVRIYKPLDFDLADSLETIVQVSDSLRNEKIDTLFVKFNNNVRNKTKFEATLQPARKKIDRSQAFSFSFNKPVNLFHDSLIYYSKDSTLILPFDSLTEYHWNSTRDKLEFISIIDTAYYFRMQRQLIIEADTISIDTTRLVSNDSLTTDHSEKENTKRKSASSKKNSSQSISNSINLTFPEGTFVSIESDTLKEISKSYSFLKKSETGIIELDISTEKTSYFIQLLDSKYEVLNEFSSESKLIIRNIIPGSYNIRILIDDNEDGVWSQGNILKNLEPESVYIMPEPTSILANWEHSLNISF